ncbi:MAG: TetR/AcrR family transcriptional regulator [Alphaproteobacteria bacterium]|nr:TetR/AcrR family transcriptional regulator [Alphaproteobacteria bacterium]
MAVSAKTLKTLGRPRGFDMDQALDRAMEVFWRKGYEGASLSDLTEAMGINPPSLYAAFGNKEGLFLKVLDRYQAGPGNYLEQAMSAPTAREAAERLLYGAVEGQCSQAKPGGCLLVHGALPPGLGAIQEELQSRRTAAAQVIRKRFERAKDEGDLPRDVDAGDLARFVFAVVGGMAVQAAGGVKKRELKKVADMAMKAFPT